MQHGCRPVGGSGRASLPAHPIGGGGRRRGRGQGRAAAGLMEESRRLGRTAFAAAAAAPRGPAAGVAAHTQPVVFNWGICCRAVTRQIGHVCSRRAVPERKILKLF